MAWRDYASYSWPGLIATVALLLVAGQQVVRWLVRWLLVRSTNYCGKHCVVTGGSEGIGFDMAMCLVRRGADVTIVARSPAKLELARQLLVEAAPASTQTIRTLACDVSHVMEISDMLKALDAQAPVFLLVCNAGVATTGYFLDLTLGQFERAMAINYSGTVACIKALAPGMVARRSGQVAIVGSALSLCGMLGFSAYAPTKWALRGLADCLRQELLPFDVSVSMCYPSDVKTPGYAMENLTKPIEALAMSESGALLDSAVAAERMIARIALGEYHIGTDFSIDLLRMPMSSTSPRSNVVLELLVVPLAALVTTCIGVFWDSIVRKHASTRPDVKRLRLGRT